MKLLIDLGNTRTKLALLSPAGLLHHREAPHGGLLVDSIKQLLSQMKPKQSAPLFNEVWIASVHQVEVEEALTHYFESHFNSISIQWVRSPSSAWGITSSYSEPHSFGVDRFLALVAARARLGSRVSCVIDCGTAVTIDLIDSTGQHQGGVIAPGFRLMQSSLQSQTARLKVPLISSEMSLLANSTASAIQKGCLYSTVGLIHYLLERFKRERGEFDVAVVVTGGDAGKIIDALPAGTIQVDDLVLQGLAVAARSEEQQ